MKSRPLLCCVVLVPGLGKPQPTTLCQLASCWLSSQSKSPKDCISLASDSQKQSELQKVEALRRDVYLKSLRTRRMTQRKQGGNTVPQRGTEI